MMILEDYFDFFASNDIRIKGHRIGIETILYEYIHCAQSPEKIASHFPTLSLEQIYATILYYLQHKERISLYLKEWLEHEDQMIAEQEKHPSSAMLRLRQIKRERALKKHQTAEYQAA